MGKYNYIPLKCKTCKSILYSGNYSLANKTFNLTCSRCSKRVLITVKYPDKVEKKLGGIMYGKKN